MKTKINTLRLKAVSTLAAAVTIVGFPMITAAQAAPPSHAPAHGYYKNKGHKNKNKNKGNRRDRREDRRERREDRRDRRDDRRDDRREDRRDDRRDDRRNDRDRNVTGRVDVYGTVVGGSYTSRLTVRGEDGRTYVVEGRNDFDSRINIGDRVRVVGEGQGSTVLAERVTLVENRR